MSEQFGVSAESNWHRGSVAPCHRLRPVGRSVRTLIARLDVDAVVRRSLLLLAAGQHGDDAQADGSDRQRSRPVLGQDAQADVPIGIDVRVNGNGCAVVQEGDLARECR